MRVAIVADIHGNLPALEAVLRDVERQAPDVVVAAGDLALRGGHPREVLQLLIDRCDAMLIGNTDAYIAGNYLGGAYREREHWKTELLEWTRDQIGADLIKTLGELPFSVRYTPRRGGPPPPRPPGSPAFAPHAVGGDFRPPSAAGERGGAPRRFSAPRHIEG